MCSRALHIISCVSNCLLYIDLDSWSLTTRLVLTGNDCQSRNIYHYMCCKFTFAHQCDFSQTQMSSAQCLMRWPPQRVELNSFGGCLNRRKHLAHTDVCLRRNDIVVQKCGTSTFFCYCSKSPWQHKLLSFASALFQISYSNNENHHLALVSVVIGLFSSKS